MSDDSRPAPELDRDAVRALVDNHRAFLGFLQKRVGDPQLAEDILQDAFVKGVEKVGDVRDEESVVAWFYRMLRNAVIDHHRRHKTKTRALDDLAREVETAAEPEAETREAVCQCVARLARTLKPEYAEALEKVEVGGMAVKDFADAAGISRSNAAVRVFRAREALRKQVAASCGTCAHHGCLNCSCGGHSLQS
jgi:RNA polymerase sigma factor (sigma-70 family)